MTKIRPLKPGETGYGFVTALRNLRKDRPDATASDRKRLIKSLAEPTCPQSLLLWASMWGTPEMKSLVATNPSAGVEALTALMLDAERAPWYVIGVLNRVDIFRDFLLDVFTGASVFAEVDSLSDLVYECYDSGLEEKWEDRIPIEGRCRTMQAELVRIFMRFADTLNYWKAYRLDYDDEMFTTLDVALDSLEGISLLNKYLLRACLRWSQLRQRGLRSAPPDDDFERYDLAKVVIAAYLVRVPKAVSVASLRQ